MHLKDSEIHGINSLNSKSFHMHLTLSESVKVYDLRKIAPTRMACISASPIISTYMTANLEPEMIAFPSEKGQPSSPSLVSPVALDMALGIYYI